VNVVARLRARSPAVEQHDFRALWAAGAASSIALWTVLLGNAWIVYKLSDSSFWVGVATFASMVPYLLAPIGGVVADHAERRMVSRLARALMLGTMVILFVLAITDTITVWFVVIVALAQGIIRAGYVSSDQALLPNTVPPGDIPNAVALSSMAQQGSRAVGPILAGPMLATIGVEGAYAVSILFAAIAFVAVGSIRTTSRGGIQSLGRVVESLGEGIHYVRTTGPVLAIFLLVVAHCSLTMSFDAMLPGFAETHLHSAAGGFTLMTLGVGVGALVGTFVLSLATGASRGPLVLATAIGSGVSPIFMALSMQVFPATVSAILMGSTQAMFMALVAMLMQETVPDAVRGRVMSLYLMSAGGIMAFANLGFGTLADRWGAPLLFWIPGSAFVLIVAVSWLAGPYMRHVYRTGRMLLPRPEPLAAAVGGE
jgi:MFS family permease